MNFLTADNLSEYAFVNFDTVVKPVRGIFLQFHGMGDMTRFDRSPEEAARLGKIGVLYVLPYYGAWGWGNRDTIRYIDLIADAAVRLAGADPGLPVVCSGGSMGGQIAFLYARDGKYRPFAMMGNCPVCNLEAVFGMNEVFRQSLLCSFAGELAEDGDFPAAMNEKNPVKIAESLPDIEYFCVFGTEDPVVTRKTDVEPMKAAMAAAGKRFSAVEIEGMGHCDIRGVRQGYDAYIRKAFALFGEDADRYPLSEEN